MPPAQLGPRTAYGWKERFLAVGHDSLEGPSTATQAMRHKKEVASLKKIIGEYAVANEALKKRGDRDRAVVSVIDNRSYFDHMVTVLTRG